ncbi:hypothetical protein [Burkholderia lata]|uniref:hypothetical protein n=1 Tax=Burkholderia lata (strain ATCC 17760 / DSM 23089 / LMG 22485 / NCIMB 9086 / R18194 / 383) TaxID=482957 RepID=UPI00158415D5|nr:hypothetical protein [Burkholderia lata]
MLAEFFAFDEHPARPCPAAFRADPLAGFEKNFASMSHTRGLARHITGTHAKGEGP